MTAAEAAPGARTPLPLRCTARAALPLALLLWLLSLRHVDLDRMGDLGLLQVLPVLYWAAVLLLTVGFVVALYLRGVGRAWLAAYVLGLIAVIHATPAVLYTNMRYAWAWKHVAVINAMIRHNGPVPNAGPLAIYNQWAGFFNLNGLFLRATGLHSPLGYAAWTPPVANALLLGPLLLLYRAITRERTLIWGGAWVFYCCSWVGQDYFSPQAFAFLLYVVLLALVFRELPTARGRPDGPTADGPTADGPTADAGPGWTAARLAPLLLIEAVIISSHQLTPLMLVTALAALSLPRVNRRVTLPLLGAAVAMELLWGLTVARPYISANLKNFSAALLSPDTNAVSGFAGVSSAAPGQVVVDWADRALSATVLLLALLSFLRRRWVRRTGLPLVALSPIPLLAANSYGGEMLFRVYLFALPATAFLAAALVLRPRPRPDLRLLGAFGLLLALLGGLFLGYDSKEEMNRFTNGEVDAARYVTSTAPRGAVLVALTDNVPGIYEHYEDHSLVQLGQQSRPAVALLVRDPLAGLQQALSGTQPGIPAYLVLTRAQAAECYLTGILPADTMARLEAAVAGRPGFTTVYRNPDAVVYRFVPVPLVPVPPLPVAVPPAPVPVPIAP